MILATTSDVIQIVTSAAVAVDVVADWIDLSGTTVSPGRTPTAITTATTTTVVASPASSTQRTVDQLTARNKGASSQDVTVNFFDGTNTMEMVKVTLQVGDTLQYIKKRGWVVLDTLGRLKTRTESLSRPASDQINTVLLLANVINNNAVANTIQDVTGLSFNVNSGETYYFRAVVPFTSAATTTGSRWSINGPASPTLLVYRSEYSLSATTRTINEGLSTYDTPAASNASAASTTANIAIVEGFITPSASGTVIVRFASEVLSSAITALAGAVLQWTRVL